MRVLQQADDDFMFQGLRARRWRTFWVDSTPLDDVRDSSVPPFVAHGTRDGSSRLPQLFDDVLGWARDASRMTGIEVLN